MDQRDKKESQEDQVQMDQMEVWDQQGRQVQLEIVGQMVKMATRDQMAQLASLVLYV